MRSVGRVFVASRATEVIAQTELARAAEEHGLEGVWVHGPPSGHGDSYATAAAAAIASMTTDLRVGVVLRLSAPDDILRLAEDVAVLDQCSSGRAELCLDGRWADDPTWRADAVRLITNMRTCPVGDRQLAVTPGPVQPAIPTLTLGPVVTGTGTAVALGSVTGTPDRGERAALYVSAEYTHTLLDAVGNADGLHVRIDRLRGDIHCSGAQDLVFVLADGPVGAHTATLASVVAPLLRANEDEVADLVRDILRFRRVQTG